LYAATGDETFRAGARRWLTRTIDQLDADDRDGDGSAAPLSGTLCSGDIGTALVLLTSAFGADPSWDACLGLG
jgi:hypothetical protein